MKMNSTSFIVSLMVTLLAYSVIAVQTNDSKCMKLSETPNKYASPQLYVFGGSDDNKSGSARYLSSASQFNSSTGKWERTMTRRKFCGAVVGTKIYLFGGNTNNNEETESAEIYDCETGIYTPFRSMSSPRQDCGAAVLDGCIYVAGGFEGDPYSSRRSASAIRHNIQTTRRENVSSMHSARYGLQLVELNSRLYAIGGDDHFLLKSVEAYNGTTDRWTPVTSTHYHHRHFGATVHAGKIYVHSVGGFEVYSPEADQWTSIARANKYMSVSLVSINSELWRLGGTPEYISTENFVFAYNISAKKWTERKNMNAARKHFTAFVVNH